MKDTLWKLKIFALYLVTEPFRQIWRVLILIRKIGSELNKTLTWVYLSLSFFVIMLLVGDKRYLGLMLLVALISLLAWEWQSGNYIRWQRKRWKDKIKEEEKK